VEEIGALSGEGMARSQSIDSFDHRDIGDPGDKWFVHFDIAIRETLINGGQLSAHQAEERRRSREQLSSQHRNEEDRWQVKGWEPSEDQRIGNRQIGIPVDEGSGKSLEETPMQNLNRPFGGKRVRSMEEVRNQRIEDPGDACTSTSQTLKPRQEID
jgi:hypothetical protein